MKRFSRTDNNRTVTLLITTAVWLLAGGFYVLFDACVYAQAETLSNRAAQDDRQLASKIVNLIEQDQWQAAAALLDRQRYEGDTFEALEAILDEHQTLETKRAEKQRQLFEERYEMLSDAFRRVTDNDPNLNYQGVFRQLQNVWRDASDSQKQDISELAVFEELMNRALENARDYYANGRWSDAYSRGAWWLSVFEPDSPDTRHWDEKLNGINDILEFLRTSPCEDKKKRYEPIRRQTVEKVFSILEDHYVRPLNYDQMAEGMMNRAIILGDVLKTESDDLVLQVDPNMIPSWIDQIQNWSAESGQTEKLNRRDFQDLLDILVALNEKTLKLPEGFLLSMLADAALAELDSYTNVVWPYAVSDFDKAMTGQFGGIGIHMRKERSGLRVLSLIPDTPAMKAGLQADALIVAVDGQRTADMSATCAVQKISGPIGTSVTLTIRYPGVDAEELITIVRDKIVVPAVEGSRQARVVKTNRRADNEPNTSMTEAIKPDAPPTATDDHWDYFLDADARIGYLHLKTFTEQSIPEVTTALDKMESSGLAGLILDLRGNGGGLLSAAIQIADLFIDDGILLNSQGRDRSFGIWPATPGGRKRTYPLVVLIDGASASASEIVAGILSSPIHKRAVLVGQRTYGKGSVQEVVDMGDAYGKLKYTAAFYYLPDGSPVKNRDPHFSNGGDDWGIKPDVNIPLYDFEQRQIRQINDRRTRISNAESQEQSLNNIQQQMLSADPQLETALLVVKAKITVADEN